MIIQSTLDVSIIISSSPLPYIVWSWRLRSASFLNTLVRSITPAGWNLAMWIRLADGLLPLDPGHHLGIGCGLLALEVKRCDRYVVPPSEAWWDPLTESPGVVAADVDTGGLGINQGQACKWNWCQNLAVEWLDQGWGRLGVQLLTFLV